MISFFQDKCSAFRLSACSTNQVCFASSTSRNGSKYFIIAYLEGMEVQDTIPDFFVELLTCVVLLADCVPGSVHSPNETPCSFREL